MTRKRALLDRLVPVPTAEDFILLEAAHMRASTRSARKRAQDALDIEQVALAADDPLDRAYLRENADRLDLWSAIQALLPT